MSRLASLLALVTAAVAVSASTQPVSGVPSFDPEARLRELKLTLPAVDKPLANYVKAVRAGDLVFLAGHVPCGTLLPRYKGKIDRERTVQEGYDAARATGLCMLASLKEQIGDLRKVKRVVKVLGMVNAPEGFTQHSQVINGCSDLLVEVLGDRGRHARSAVGVASLPFDFAVEIEMIVEVEN